MFRDSDADRHLLGDGHHPAPQRGRHRQGDRQPRPAPGQHRQARRRAVPGARPLQRAGRPDDGHLGAAARTLPRRAARRVRLRAAARARVRHRGGRSRRSATGRPGCSSGWAATSCPPRPTPRSPRQALRSAALTVHVSTKLNRSHVVHRRRGADPARARPQREGPDRRRRRSGSPSRTRCQRGARLAAGRSSRPRRTCAPRSTSSARWRRRRSATGTASRGRRSGPTTPRSAAGSRGWSPAATRTTRRSTSPAASRCRTRRGTAATFPTDDGQGDLHGQPDRRAATCPRGGCCCRRCARTTSSTPRSTGSTTATAAIKGGRRVVFVHPDDIAALGLADGRDGRPGQRVDEDGSERTAPSVPGGRLRPAARVRRGVLPGDEPAGPAGLHGRSAATARRPSRSSSGSSRRRWRAGRAGQQRRRDGAPAGRGTSKRTWSRST